MPGIGSIGWKFHLRHPAQLPVVDLRIPGAGFDEGLQLAQLMYSESRLYVSYCI